MKRYLRKLVVLVGWLGNFTGVVTGLIVLAVVYTAVGSLIAVPYTFLAGGTEYYCLFMTMYWPVVALTIFLAWYTCRWKGLAFLALPIILRGISLVLAQMGQTALADFLARYNYASIPVALAALVCWSAIAGRLAEPKAPSTPQPPLPLPTPSIVVDRNDNPSANGRLMNLVSDTH